MRTAHAYELSKLRFAQEEAEMRWKDKLGVQLADQARRHNEDRLQKDLQINILERKVLEHENRHERDQQEISLLQKQVRDLTADLASQRMKMEESLKRVGEDAERVKRETERAEGKIKEHCNEEKEALKKEYETLISNLRTEYSRLTDTLRAANEAQSGEISLLTS